MPSSLIAVKTAMTTLGESELAEIKSQELARFQPQAMEQAPEVLPPAPDLLHGRGMLLNDTGNAQRLIALCGERMRYCFETRKWLVFDGQRWISDPGHLALKAAKSVMAEYYLQASSVSNREHERFAHQSMNQANIRHMLASAESELPISASQLDAHPFLLNCLNGVLDLRTKQLRPHDPGLLLTKLVHHEYRPDAKAPRFRQFTERIMGRESGGEMSQKTRELIGYLQRILGCALTGDASVKAVFCFFGAGDNGKTTLIEAFRHVIFEFSSQIDIESIMARPGSSSTNVQSDLADLRGARFVTTSEAGEGQRLNAAKLKYLSAGMGEIKTVRKYENPITFPATHKLFMDSNHRPVVSGSDQAVWNRLQAVPFEVSIPAHEKDPTLLHQLKAEAEGILAWAVEGCWEWQQRGLDPPEAVKFAGSSWRKENAPLDGFFAQCCEFAPEAWCHRDDLFTAYGFWCQQHAATPITVQKFAAGVRERGCQQDRIWNREERNHENIWRGLRLKPGVSFTGDT